MTTDCYCQKCGSRLICDTCRARNADLHRLGNLTCDDCGWRVDVVPLVLARIGNRSCSIAEFNAVAEDVLREPPSGNNGGTEAAGARR